MRTTHCTEHTAGERVACQSGKEVARTGVDRHVRTTGYYVGGIAVYMTLLAEQGQWFTSGVERHTYHLRAFGDEHGVGRRKTIAELRFGQRGEYCHAGMVECRYFYYCH